MKNNFSRKKNKKITTYLLFMIKQVSNMNEIIKMKISNKLKGKKKNETTKRLISKSLKGKKKSQSHKQAISEAMKFYWECYHRKEENQNSPLIKMTKPAKKQDKIIEIIKIENNDNL